MTGSWPGISGTNRTIPINPATARRSRRKRWTLVERCCRKRSPGLAAGAQAAVDQRGLEGRLVSTREAHADGKIQLGLSDVISFHNYDQPEEFEKRMQWLSAKSADSVHGVHGARQQEHIRRDSAGREKVQSGGVQLGFVAGKTQTYLPWDSWKKPYTDREPASGSTRSSIPILAVPTAPRKSRLYKGDHRPQSPPRSCPNYGADDGRRTGLGHKTGQRQAVSVFMTAVKSLRLYGRIASRLCSVGRRRAEKP